MLNSNLKPNLSIVLTSFCFVFAFGCSTTVTTQVNCQQLIDGTEIIDETDEFSLARLVLEKDLEILGCEQLLAPYFESVDSSLGLSPVELLKRYLPHSSINQEVKSIEVILDNPEYFIREARPLEQALLINQMQRHRGDDFLTSPTEFLAIHLERKEQSKILIFTNDMLGVRLLGIFFQEVARAVEQGYRATWNLHNHSYFLDDLEGNSPQGVLAPSTADMMVFRFNQRDFDLAENRMTDGRFTVVIESDDLDLFDVENLKSSKE